LNTGLKLSREIAPNTPKLHHNSRSMFYPSDLPLLDKMDLPLPPNSFLSRGFQESFFLSLSLSLALSLLKAT
jgi:hypothetical protein